MAYLIAKKFAGVIAVVMLAYASFRLWRHEANTPTRLMFIGSTALALGLLLDELFFAVALLGATGPDNDDAVSIALASDPFGQLTMVVTGFMVAGLALFAFGFLRYVVTATRRVSTTP